jgi:predicted permease
MRGDSKFTWVSTQYFETMGIPLLAGRDFTAHDTANAPHVAIVNEAFVRQFLPGAPPIGRVVRTRSEPDYPATGYEIVGVARDSKYAGLREAIPAQVFAPLTQFPGDMPWETVFIHSTAPLASVASAFKRRIGELHPEIQLGVQAFRDEIEGGLVSERLMAALSGFFGVLAALLASIGLYGVISYIVLRRRNEIGIRMALGASRQEVVRMIMREAAMLLAAGMLTGVLISSAVTRGASALLYGLKANDLATFVTAAALLAVITLVASFWPARRAARLDPISALRWE